ncbi:hypothetical protein C8N31_107157 [Sulfitobacter mediterraneus]|uniref:Uncharacterized protein n=1 Tax=Sulfitobacter mediterraneus TaxID=83219 RepID=A0A2T6CD84_9RHOB|nr:hypothetical protein C8N31_107157 [Sulfitobacter mediterraneus]
MAVKLAAAADGGGAGKAERQSPVDLFSAVLPQKKWQKKMQG